MIKADDYIAIGLLSALDASWLPQVVLKVMLEEAEQVLPILVVEVSTDGYHWVSLLLLRSVLYPR